MVALRTDRRHLGPFGLVVSGEAGEYVDALRMIVGTRWIETFPARTDGEVIDLVRRGVPDAVFLDDEAVQTDTLKLLRTIRRLNEAMLVVLLTGRTDRRWLEDALRLAAFSVVIKPLRLEELLVQVHRMMVRMDIVIRRERF